MSAITTHVLDTAKGSPAEGIEIELEYFADEAKSTWVSLGHGVTNNDGRVLDLLAKKVALRSGTYRLTFFVDAYFKKQKIKTFYSTIPIVFKIETVKKSDHYHVPLLLNPFGYTTYRGS